MNSFRELLESLVETEETIRFRGIDWVVTPNIEAPCFNRNFERWIPLFAEIGGKKFLFHRNNRGDHIGFRRHEEGVISLLAEIDGVEWISKVDEDWWHMGFNKSRWFIMALSKRH